MLTTHEKIRLEAGVQNEFDRQAFINSPNGNLTTFYVDTDSLVKIVPNFGTGTTIAGASDVKVWTGLSGVVGASLMTVSSLDPDIGSVTLNVAPVTGSSLTVSFASSDISSERVENIRTQAESIINQRLSLCYDLPISPTPSVLTSMASRLGSALLLIRDYGVGSRSTSKDGYALWEQLMGRRTNDDGDDIVEVGEIGMICRLGYQLVDDSGSIIARNDENQVTASTTYLAGGRVRGRLHNVTDETFRYKDFQADANAEQAGSNNNSVPRQQV